ncbi:hypothetical protein CSIM01_13310 [Colletotrichum simmondsii]|uniref:Uncharacterized protein n=1 Tax=Colletotrichum simmondsii TaxID=703756 RepID=A0A135RT17_9PEZI|nr:hypothetical protein CSIM01_13310 [Colletotrichum simmondsii]
MSQTQTDPNQNQNQNQDRGTLNPIPQGPPKLSGVCGTLILDHCPGPGNTRERAQLLASGNPSRPSSQLTAVSPTSTSSSSNPSPGRRGSKNAALGLDWIG